MLNHKNYKTAFFLLILLVLLGCAVTTAPSGWLPTNSQTQRQAFGGWIQVHCKLNSGPKQSIKGELIAIHADTLYVLMEQKFHAIAIPDITKARLVFYDSRAELMGTLATLGCISTLSHGFYLILTAPFLWMMGGGIFAYDQSRKPIIDYPQQSLDDFKKYARFPMGLPEGFSRDKLKPKMKGM